MISCAVFCVVLGALLAAMPAVAADDVTSALEAFYGICLGQGPDYERTEAAAKAMGWQPIPTEWMGVLAPVEQADAYAGWIATDLAVNAMVAVTKAHYHGEPVQTCTVAVDKIDGAAFERAFIERMNPRKLGDDSDGIQAFRVYTLEVGATEQLVSITYGLSPGLAGMVVASTMAKSP